MMNVFIYLDHINVKFKNCDGISPPYRLVDRRATDDDNLILMRGMALCFLI